MSTTAGGSVRSRLQDQMRRLFNLHVQLVYEHEHGEVSVNSLIADRTEFWWNHEAARRPHAVGKQDRTWREVLRGSHSPPSAARPEHPEDYEAIFVGPRSLHVAHLPDVHAQGSAAALLAATVPPVRIEPGPGKRHTNIVNDFRTKCLRELTKIKSAWPDLHYSTPKGVLLLSPSPPRIPPAQLRLVK